MKRVFETAECEEVRNSIFWVRRYETHENQMKGCDVELKDWQMNTWTSWVCDTVKARQGMADDRYAMLCGPLEACCQSWSSQSDAMAPAG